MAWIKVTSGSLVHYIPADKLVRIQVVNGSTMSIYVETTAITNFPVTDWNNGRALDDTFADVGANPYQV